MLLFSSVNTVNAQEIHVSPKGKDVNTGTMAKPVSTLEAAKKLVRKAISAKKNTTRWTKSNHTRRNL